MQNPISPAKGKLSRKDVITMAGLNKVTVEDLNVKGKKVLVRVDFNVPLKDGVITNDNRITAALPTINKLVADGGKVVFLTDSGDSVTVKMS